MGRDNAAARPAGLSQSEKRNIFSALFPIYVPAEAMPAIFGGNKAFGVLTADRYK